MPHIHCVTLGAPVFIKSHSKLIFQKLNLNLELGKVQCSSSKNWFPVQASFVVKIERVPKRLSRMAQNSVWSMTGMSTLLGRDTTAGLLTCKRRRLESEQQSTSDLSRRHNLCAVLTVVIHDLETDEHFFSTIGISPSMQLGMSLRYLAGGSYLDIDEKKK